MTSPAYSVFIGDGGTNTPKRPTAAVDLGGLSFVDSVKYPPKDRERLAATDFMQVTMCEEAIARMIPMLRADLRLETGGETVGTVVSVNSALTTANVTVTETAPGIYTLAWPASSLPTPNTLPTAVVTSAGSMLFAYISLTSQITAEIEIFDATGTHSAAQCYVSVSVY